MYSYSTSLFLALTLIRPNVMPVNNAAPVLNGEFQFKRNRNGASEYKDTMPLMFFYACFLQIYDSQKFDGRLSMKLWSMKLVCSPQGRYSWYFMSGQYNYNKMDLPSSSCKTWRFAWSKFTLFCGKGHSVYLWQRNYIYTSEETTIKSLDNMIGYAGSLPWNQIK